MATDAGQIYVFDVAAASLATTFNTHAMCVRSLSWSADSQVPNIYFGETLTNLPDCYSFFFLALMTNESLFMIYAPHRRPKPLEERWHT